MFTVSFSGSATWKSPIRLAGAGPNCLAFLSTARLGLRLRSTVEGHKAFVRATDMAPAALNGTAVKGPYACIHTLGFFFFFFGGIIGCGLVKGKAAIAPSPR